MPSPIFSVMAGDPEHVEDEWMKKAVAAMMNFDEFYGLTSPKRPVGL